MLMVGAACICLGGCVTETESGRTIRDGGLDEMPDEFVIHSVAQLVGRAVDTDADGRVDSIPVTVYLMAHSATRTQIAVWATGHFEFELTDRNDRPIATWSFAPDETDAMRVRGGAVGRAYRTVLELSDDDLAVAGRSWAGALGCRFVPVEGDPIETDKPVSVIGGDTFRRDGP